MEQNIKDELAKIPEEIAHIFFEHLNAKIVDIMKGTELNPLHIADLMHSVLTNILGSYVTNFVEPGIREYITSKLLFGMAGNLHAHLQTLEVTKTPTEVLDPNKSV